MVRTLMPRARATCFDDDPVASRSRICTWRFVKILVFGSPVMGSTTASMIARSS